MLLSCSGGASTIVARSLRKTGFHLPGKRFRLSGAAMRGEMESRGKPAIRREGAGRAPRQGSVETVAEIIDAIGKARRAAEARGLPMVVYLLDMAALEAAERSGGEGR